MEQSRNKDKWVEEILSSTDGIKRAEAGPYIFPKILHRLKTNNIGNVIPIRKAAIGFLTVLLLAVLNIFVVLGVNNKTGNVTANQQNTEGSSEFIPSQYNPYLETLTR